MLSFPAPRCDCCACHMLPRSPLQPARARCARCRCASAANTGIQFEPASQTSFELLFARACCRKYPLGAENSDEWKGNVEELRTYRPQLCRRELTIDVSEVVFKVLSTLSDVYKTHGLRFFRKFLSLYISFSSVVPHLFNLPLNSSSQAT